MPVQSTCRVDEFLLKWSTGVESRLVRPGVRTISSTRSRGWNANPIRTVYRKNFLTEDNMRTKILIVAASLLVVGTVAGAQGRRGGGPPGGGPPGGRCAMTADSLTDAQKRQVRALGDAFVKAHAAQLDSLKAIGEAARAAREAGKTPEEVRAIMEQGKPIADALAPAQKEFRETVVTYLTPAQLAAGCIPPAPGGMGPGGRRGGPPPKPPVG